LDSGYNVVVEEGPPAGWWDIYRQIAKDLNIDISTDRSSTQLLSSLLESKGASTRKVILAAEQMIRAKRAFVFGAGISLRADLIKLIESNRIQNSLVVGSDGAVRYMLEMGIVPNIIVSDLDGCPDCISEVTGEGGVAFIHAHGDNIPLISKWLPLVSGMIVGTTQVEPRKNVINVGGFTDGDRAVHLMAAFGASEIVLAGMDFGNMVSKYSKPWMNEDEMASDFKLKKLKWGKLLLERLAMNPGPSFYNATSEGEDIKGYRRISFTELP